MKVKRSVVRQSTQLYRWDGKEKRNLTGRVKDSRCENENMTVSTIVNIKKENMLVQRYIQLKTYTLDIYYNIIILNN